MATDCNMNNSMIYDIPVFDASNDNNKCNDLHEISNIKIVAEPSEPYIGNTCKDIVENYYVPNSDIIDKNLAPLLPPYVLQTIQEYTITAIENLIPKFLTSSCLISQRKYMCTLMFMKPFRSDVLLNIIGNEIYLPSYPQYDICNTYINECNYLISVVPQLGMNCSIKVNDDYLFPKKEAIIANLNLGNGYIINLISPANILNSTNALTFNILTECPYSMVVPTNPTKSTIVWISGTGCALKCPSAAYTDQEYSTMFTSTIITDWLCTILCLISYLNIYKTEPKKRNIFLMLQVGLVALYYCSRGSFLASSYNTFYDNDPITGKEIITNKVICTTNASTRSLEEINKLQKSTGCIAFAITQLIIEFISYWFCLALVIELWCKVVLSIKDVTFCRKIYIGGGSMITLGLILLNIYYAEAIIAVDSNLWCVWQSKDPNIVFYIKGLPYCLIYGAFTLLSCHIFYTCIKISTAVKSNLSSIWKTFKVLFMIILLLVFYYPTGLGWGFIFYGKFDYNKIVKSYTKWMTCQMINFKSNSINDQKELMNICGTVPLERVSLMFFYTLLATAYLAAVVLLLITLNNDVIKYYGELFKYYHIDGITDMIYNYIFTPLYYLLIRIINIIPGINDLSNKINDINNINNKRLSEINNFDSLNKNNINNNKNNNTPIHSYSTNCDNTEIEIPIIKPSEIIQNDQKYMNINENNNDNIDV